MKPPSIMLLTVCSFEAVIHAFKLISREKVAFLAVFLIIMLLSSNKCILMFMSFNRLVCFCRKLILDFQSPLYIHHLGFKKNRHQLALIYQNLYVKIV